MVPQRRLALTPTDRLLAAYFGIVTLVLVARGPFTDGRPWLLLAHALFGVLLLLFTRLDVRHRTGHLFHMYYPLLFLAALYAEIGVLNGGLGLERILAHDQVVQRWETALFGGQISYTWIRQAPSVFWSGLFHLAYLAYYPIILLTAPLLALVGRPDAARRVIFAMMAAFVTCYLVFVLYPVAGPNYAYPHPTGAVRGVWSAKVVYAMLAGGSSVGAAFPSSHVAATLAVTIAAWQGWRTLGWILVLPFVLLTIGTVYAQMHYGVDAASGLLTGAAAGYLCSWVWPSAAVESGRINSAIEPRTSRR